MTDEIVHHDAYYYDYNGELPYWRARGRQSRVTRAPAPCSPSPREVLTRILPAADRATRRAVGRCGRLEVVSELLCDDARAAGLAEGDEGFGWLVPAM